jgi:hypothetical protein
MSRGSESSPGLKKRVGEKMPSPAVVNRSDEGHSGSTQAKIQLTKP